MASNDEQSFRSFSYDDELKKARWYHEDLQAGGWREVKMRNATFWVKSFDDQAIPTKMLIKFDVPFSAKQFTEVLSPKNMEYRKKWDKAFFANEVLEEYPENGGYIITNTREFPWPLSDREFVLFIPRTKEVDWYGKPAFHVIYINAWHSSRPANEGACVRGTNGGNFFIVIPDENDPDNACTVFGLSHNRFNGWLPKTNIEWLIARNVPKAFVRYFESLVEGEKMFFEELQDLPQFIL